MSRPKFTIVTASFNASRTIRDTIESVRRQDFTDWEHWIINGASKDETLQIVNEYPHLKFISEKDSGLYEAMNKGIQRASGEILLMLNADDCLEPGTLSKVAADFARHPEWDTAFGDIIYVDGQGNEIYRREEAVYDYDVLRFSSVCYVIHQTLFVKKATHERIGLYRNKDFISCADYEFILRMGRENCRVGHVPAYIVKYRIHEFGQTADSRMVRNMRREAALITKEYGRPDGFAGAALKTLMKGKRQFQKLVRRGKLDLVPGTRKLRKHVREKNSFSTNSTIPVEK